MVLCVTYTAGSKGQCGVIDLPGNSQHTVMSSGTWPGLMKAAAHGHVWAVASWFILKELNRSIPASVCYLLKVGESPVSHYMCLAVLSASELPVLHYFDYTALQEQDIDVFLEKESQENWSLMQSKCNNKHWLKCFLQPLRNQYEIN